MLNAGVDPEKLPAPSLGMQVKIASRVGGAFYASFMMLLERRDELQEGAANSMMLTDGDVVGHHVFWAWEQNSFDHELENLYFVSLYHFAERTLRLTAKLIGNTKASTVNKFEHIRDAFEAENQIRIVDCKRYREIDLLRQLTNSWKHSPEVPNEKLVRALDLGRADVRFHLEDPKFRAAFAKKLHAPDGDSAPSVAWDAVREFFDDLGDKVDLLPQPKP